MGLKGAVEIVACPRSLAVGDSDPWVKQAATIRLLSSKTSLYSSEQVYWALSDQRLRHQRNSATCCASAKVVPNAAFKFELRWFKRVILGKMNRETQHFAVMGGSRSRLQAHV
jgi:hypothetical protein